MRDEQAARRARGEKGRGNYEAFLEATHKRWRSMTDAEREPWNCRAEALPKAMPKINVDAEAVADGTSGQSAWGIGSSSYPCSSEVILQAVNELLPEGRTWLRRAYDLSRLPPLRFTSEVYGVQHYWE